MVPSLRVLPRNGVLELHQAALAVHAVPVQHRVQRVEEGLVVLQRDFTCGLICLWKKSVLKRLTVVWFSAKPGASNGKTSLGSGEGLNSPGTCECSPSMKMPRAKFLPVEAQSTQLTVYSTLLVLLLQVEELVDAVELDALVVDAARDDGLQPKLRPGDEAGEAHAADGGGVPVGVLGGRAEAARAVGADQFEARDVVAEGAGDVVVLAVDVVGDGAAEGDVLGSGRDGQEESARHGEVEDLRERDARFGGEHAGRGIEVDQAVHAGGLQQGAVLEQADVAVAAAQADGERAVVQARPGRPGKSLCQFSGTTLAPYFG